MSGDSPLSWDTFLSISEASGLDVNDPHMEELYAFLQGILPLLRTVHDLDLTGVDPATRYFPPQE
mgnify:CR=1 FL=1